VADYTEIEHDSSEGEEVDQAEEAGGQVTASAVAALEKRTPEGLNHELDLEVKAGQDTTSSGEAGGEQTNWHLQAWPFPPKKPADPPPASWPLPAAGEEQPA
jgi:hypothetical protein